MTLCITTFSITTFSIRGLFATLSINDNQHNNTTTMPSVIMVSVIMLSVVMLNVAMLCVVVPETVLVKTYQLLGGKYYKTFYGFNLRIFVISWNVCLWQAFPA
jgi:hypothetical protein